MHFFGIISQDFLSCSKRSEAPDEDKPFWLVSKGSVTAVALHSLRHGPFLILEAYQNYDKRL